MLTELGKCPYLRIATEDQVPPVACARGYDLFVGKDGQPHPNAINRALLERCVNLICTKIPIGQDPLNPKIK